MRKVVWGSGKKGKENAMMVDKSITTLSQFMASLDNKPYPDRAVSYRSERIGQIGWMLES